MKAGDVLVVVDRSSSLLLGCVEGTVSGGWLVCGSAASCAGVSADAGSADGVSTSLECCSECVIAEWY